ncbi:DUF2461 domain-containing protein [Echinicola sp. CAU 1574]|uniref:DUF2461 domain-containing protein n=1 Tax=Echinicola arenosa TaxID=2774144 RepID=A0ABR9AJD9_9BACT|nr:DUF2461 domain-containing protein [Echinicola arenosa]MBD8487968.1 DUF2461 domain-containing protein [Echinicola arenosa]
MKNDTLEFLSSLAKHNNKEWMDANRDWYLDVKAGFLETVTALLTELSKIDSRLSLLKAKECIFRQNRDIRFSANKNPYKNNMGAYFAVGGKKSDGPGYYLHIQPGECFLAGGIWMPSSGVLKKIRQEVDYSGAELEKIIADQSFQMTFGEIKGERLKTSPRDYSADHPYVDFLRLKSFVVSAPLSDQEALSDNLVDICMATYQKMNAFNGFLERAVEEAESGEGIL